MSMGKLFPNLHELAEDMNRCNRCGFCRTLCPTWNYGWEMDSPRGRIQLANALLNKDVTTNAILYEKFFQCTLCGYCQWKCPAGLQTLEVYKAARSLLLNNGSCAAAVKEIRDSVENSHNMYNYPNEKRTQWIETMGLEDVVKEKEKAETILFVGCVSSFSPAAMDIAKATALILNEVGEDWSILGSEEWCCGDPLSMAGQTRSFSEIAQHNIGIIRKTRAKSVVFSCGECYRAFALDYPKAVGNLDFKVYHISRYISEQIGKGNIQFRKSMNSPIAYHDPCMLGRLCGMYDEPREAIKSIPGVELIELPRNRELSSCCGGGGLLTKTYPKLALEIAERRITEIEATGATLVASACPTCKLTIQNAALEKKKDIRVLDLTELVAKAMGLSIGQP